MGEERPISAGEGARSEDGNERTCANNAGEGTCPKDAAERTGRAHHPPAMDEARRGSAGPAPAPLSDPAVPLGEEMAECAGPLPAALRCGSCKFLLCSVAVARGQTTCFGCR